MTVLLKILQICGIALLAVTALLVWIILVPRHFWVEYSKQDGPEVKMNIAFFRFRIYPLPPFAEKLLDKKEKQKKQLPASGKNKDGTDIQHVHPAEQKTDKPGVMDDIQLSFDLIKEAVSAAGGIMKRVLKAIKFRDVSFTVPLHTQDVLKTQQLYGAVTNSFYTLNTFLQKYMQLYYKSPVFVADFAGRYSDALYFYCKITASPVLLLSAAYFAYSQYNHIKENNKKATVAQEKENNNGQTELNS